MLIIQHNIYVDFSEAVGPDNICGRLKLCTSLLSVVFSQVFMWSLKEITVPLTWKTSVICPVPKKKWNPSWLNLLWWSVLNVSSSTNLWNTKPHLDPYQFVYRHNSSTKDPTLTILHNAYTRLEKTGSFVQILFINFSSTFNTIQPHLMASKLLKLNVIVNPRLILWIVDFLVSHSQTVHH